MVAVDRYLEGRIAIITGGFAGIGKAIALALAERGATIAVGARRQPEAVIDELQAVSDAFFINNSMSLIMAASMLLSTGLRLSMGMPISSSMQQGLAHTSWFAGTMRSPGSR